MADVYTIGETMARVSSPATGPLRHSPNLQLGIAGAEANVAIGLSRLGVDAQWMGRVGDDEFGRLITSVLKGEGVTTDAIVDPDGKTGLLFKERRTATRRRIMYYRTDSAGSRVTPGDIDADAIRAAKVLHLTGITAALSDSALATVRESIGIAKEAGTTVSLDLNYRKALWDAAKAGEVLRGLIAKSDIVFAGVDEARLVADGDDTWALAQSLVDLGATYAVIKKGSDGASMLHDGVRYEAPIYRTEEIDPVGAGDAFCAGFIAQWVFGGGMDAMLDMAAKCGAFSVTVDGDWEGLPSYEDLDLFAEGDVQR